MQGDFDLELLITDNDQYLDISAGTDPPLQLNLSMQPKLEVRVEAGAGVKLRLACKRFHALGFLDGVRANSRALEVEKLSLYGTSHLTAQALSGNFVDLRVAADSTMEIAGLVADELQLLASGRGRAVLAGETGRLTVEAGSDARVDALGLAGQWVDVHTRGTADVAVHASAHLGGIVDEQSRLSYLGQPDLHLSSQQQGNIVRLTRN